MTELPESIGQLNNLREFGVRQDKTTKKAVLATQRSAAEYSASDKVWARVNALW